RATLAEYQQQAHALLDALRSGDEAAAWHFKWQHPRFRGKSVKEVQPAALELADALVVVAHDYGFETWADVAEYTDAVQRDGPVARFEAAVEAVGSGEIPALRSMLAAHPDVVSPRR